MNEDLKLFYGLVKRTRSNVLDWMETLPEEVFTQQQENFAYGSLSAIYQHIARCYLVWVGSVGLKEVAPVVPAGSVAELREAFEKVDRVVERALETFDQLDAPLVWTSRSGKKHTLSQRWLILHPITHEFHHKGQALALARVIGYPHPGHPDTDLVDPEFG